jgi:hypothetical protein
MSKLVTNLDSAVAGIEGMDGALKECPDLAERLGQAHAFYVHERPNGELRFGFSKFVGYQDMTPERYLRDYKELDGRNTEHALSTWFEEVRPQSRAYRELFDRLSDWLAGYGKRPRGGTSQQVRLMVVRPEYRESTDETTDDRKLLDLLIAVADTLPTRQRHELRASL